MIIFLIGMPGAGKTYWSKRLALEYGLGHTDLDESIEEIACKTIPQIFREDGEEAFREMEATTLRNVTQSVKGDTIISCGGGTPVFHDNLAYMKTQGCIVYLQASISYLADRLKNADTKRPLIDDAVEEKLEELFKKRKNIYEQAHQIVDAETLTVGNFAEIIAQCKHQH